MYVSAQVSECFLPKNVPNDCKYRRKIQFHDFMLKKYIYKYIYFFNFWFKIEYKISIRRSIPETFGRFIIDDLDLIDKK